MQKVTIVALLACLLGAGGCASHLAKLVPPMKLRQMVFTCEPVSAAQLYEWGTVYKLTEPDDQRRKEQRHDQDKEQAEEDLPHRVGEVVNQPSESRMVPSSQVRDEARASTD